MDMIWAAILVVALQLVPAAAFAHNGQHFGHRHHSVAAVTSHAHAPLQQQAGPSDRHSSEQILTTASGQPDQPESGPSGGCTGGCCGTGHGCCGAALIAATNSLPDVHRAADIVSFQSHVRPGIEPDTPARPPRTLV